MAIDENMTSEPILRNIKNPKFYQITSTEKKGANSRCSFKRFSCTIRFWYVKLNVKGKKHLHFIWVLANMV